MNNTTQNVVETIVEMSSRIELSEGASTPKKMENFIKKLHVFCKRNGIDHNPVGAGDVKTGTTGTYRPVLTLDGETSCPSYCPYNQYQMNKDGKMVSSCYAKAYHTDMCQRRASTSTERSIVATAIAASTAARHDTVARLCVTGDAYTSQGVLDTDYLEGVIHVAEEIRRVYGNRKNAMYSYTHIREEEYGDWLCHLDEVGVHVRISDKYGFNGAIVHPHDQFDSLKDQFPNLRFTKCPAQLTHNAIQCRRCKMCWATPQSIIVFDPHGPGARTAAQKARDIRLTALNNNQ